MVPTAPKAPSPYGNRRRDPRTGRFVGRFASRQTLQQLADLPDQEWATDEAALEVLAAAIELAIKDGWRPPAEVDLDGGAT
jgi:hypothetical protein